VSKLLGGQYELIELAAEGGMAAVWRAVRRGAAGFTVPVAVKMIKHQFKADREYITMFVEEARVGAELHHAHIVPVHDFGRAEDGSYYLVMEWVEGMSLRTFVHAHAATSRVTPWPIVGVIVMQALRGLGAAHRRQKDGHPAPIIHRDVSPENILLGLNGVAKLSDFGFARAKDRLERTTQPGIIKGKITYLAPEMTHGAEPSAQSDLFSMGVTLWEALAADKLFHGEALEVLHQLRRGEIRPLAPLRPDLPPELLRVVGRALEPDPEKRFRAAGEMTEALSAVLRTVPRVSDAILANAVQEARGWLTGIGEHPATMSSLPITVDLGDFEEIK
jgi:serine/threonine-protein kinase